jgi:hypothetical protein
MNPLASYSQQNASTYTQSQQSTILSGLTKPLSKNSLIAGLMNQNQTQNSSGSIFDYYNSKVSINTTAIQKTLWNQLEKKVTQYESKNPGIKGNIVVAIKQGQAGNMPTFKLLDKNDVVSLMKQDSQTLGKKAIEDHPVQVFSKTNIDNLKTINLPELNKVISDFITKNKSVFEFLNSADQTIS